MLGLEPSAARRGGSTPSIPTNLIENMYKLVFMQTKKLAFVLFYFCSLILSSDESNPSEWNAKITSDLVLTVEDGRIIKLNLDGTWELLGIQLPAIPCFRASDNASVVSHYFKYIEEEDSIRFMPIFQNNYKKTIKAIKFDSLFKDVFGEVIFKLDDLRFEDRIPPCKQGVATVSYIWESGEEGYKLLYLSAKNGNGSIDTKVTKIIFDDGEILTFTDD